MKYSLEKSYAKTIFLPSRSVVLNLFWLAAHLAPINYLAAHQSVTELDKYYENNTYIYGVLRFCGTPKEISRHISVSRHTG